MNDVLRRRSVGAPAARSTLLTVLGEFLLQRPDGAWQEALIGALALLGYTPSAARQAVVRSTREGWLEAERIGRRSRMRLTASSAELLRDGARRIYGFGDPASWDGRWLLLVLRVPEQRRELRHRLTTQLAWAGFGSLGGGLWITPHFDREALVQAEAPAQLLSFRAELGAFGGTTRVISEAWDLPELRERYEQFIADFTPRPPAGRRGRVRRPDRARARLAAVPVRRPGPAGRPAPARLAAPAGQRAVPRAPRALGGRRPGPLRRARGLMARVYVAYAGGTIGMQATDSGYAPVPGYLPQAIARAAGAQRARGAGARHPRALAAAGLGERAPGGLAADRPRHRRAGGRVRRLRRPARHGHDGLHRVRAGLPAARARTGRWWSRARRSRSACCAATAARTC